ncbi:spore protease YyaC [Moorella sp. E308F]|uniref:spore protease YyaC n=1 Tax=unclassified Neomoorella TaxID=2676739 RepID=UPI0010FFB7FC|nr:MULTISPECIES: spore protease YyaC [unclassified Moorella (in: firmicutes)]GEA15459.1 spore protease YyaC [Moorella sp. E308F]GEA19683.1 spore protease YyaC [Moorella sp. E306M]
MHEARRFCGDPRAAQDLGRVLRRILLETAPGLSFPPVVACIGTDRAMGDCLGPLVGTFLKKKHPEWPIFGTLAEPLHALNLPETLEIIRTRHAGKPVIAVDSAFGETFTSVGDICIRKGSCQPGSGLNKNLPPVGDAYLTGVINVGTGTALDLLTLQNTRLYLVWRMAEVIVEAIEIGIGDQQQAGMEAAVLTTAN